MLFYHSQCNILKIPNLTLQKIYKMYAIYLSFTIKIYLLFTIQTLANVFIAFKLILLIN